MTLEDLIRRFRAMTRDTQTPYLWSNEDLIDWLNDAQDQACMRGRLLIEDENPAICEIALTAGVRTYPLHKLVLEIIHAQIDPVGSDEPRPVSLVTREWLDNEIPGWRNRTDLHGYAVQNETNVLLTGDAVTGDTLRIECSRLPIKKMESDMDKPEIHQASHVHLLEWALYQAYSVTDSEAFDPARAEKAKALFAQHFGMPVDRDLLRDTRKDLPQHNVAIFL